MSLPLPRVRLGAALPSMSAPGQAPGWPSRPPCPRGSDTLGLMWCLQHPEQVRLPMAVSPVELSSVLCCSMWKPWSPRRTFRLPPGALLGPEKTCLCWKPQDGLWCAGLLCCLHSFDEAPGWSFWWEMFHNVGTVFPPQRKSRKPVGGWDVSPVPPVLLSTPQDSWAQKPIAPQPLAQSLCPPPLHLGTRALPTLTVAGLLPLCPLPEGCETAQWACLACSQEDTPGGSSRLCLSDLVHGEKPEEH